MGSPHQTPAQAHRAPIPASAPAPTPALASAAAVFALAVTGWSFGVWNDWFRGKGFYGFDGFLMDRFRAAVALDLVSSGSTDMFLSLFSSFLCFISLTNALFPFPFLGHFVGIILIFDVDLSSLIFRYGDT